MTDLMRRRHWLGPALATALWIGLAPVPFSNVTADEIGALWGHAARAAAELPREPAKAVRAATESGPSQPPAVPDSSNLSR